MSDRFDADVRRMQRALAAENDRRARRQARREERRERRARHGAGTFMTAPSALSVQKTHLPLAAT